MSSSEVRDAFDAVAARYDAFYSTPDDMDEDRYMSEMLQEWRLRINPAGDCPTLDVGCGTGKLLDLALFRASEYHGMDISPKMLAALHAEHPEYANLVEWDFNRRWPYADNQFSQVISLYGSVSYAEDPAFLWREIMRVLRPGGQALTMWCSEHHKGARIFKVDGLTGAVLGVGRTAEAIYESAADALRHTSSVIETRGALKNFWVCLLTKGTAE